MLATAAAVSALTMLAGAAAIAPISDPGASGNEFQRPGDPSFQVVSDTEIIADGHTFHSWQELADAGFHHLEATHCGTSSWIDPDADPGFRGGSDCSGFNTNISPQWDPSVAKYRIPVVVHILISSSGAGDMPDERVTSQIEILNEDFQAMAGTNGALGNDAQIEFYLATEDPDGNPTDGITRSVNTTWFNDGGGYYNTLAWDTDRYLNIYTNTASGNLGYVPSLPQGGIVGSDADRVVILYSTFGRNAPYVPFNLGRTVTHEVGHYLGLDHTFAGGCSNGYTSGDLIADTNPESSPTFGCPGSRNSCGQPAPFHNYMDYADDPCMTEFTIEQNNRMRCTLVNYRPDLYTIADPEGCSDADLAEPYGQLDFFDVSAFLDAYNNARTNADIDHNGDFDYFDVSLFLGTYNAGCP